MKKRASTILIVEKGKVLAVSRKDNPNDFGLPGGKCEEGESFEACAARELMEETGLRVYDLDFIFSREDGEFIVHTFVPKIYYGNIITHEKGKVAWIEPKVLTTGSFGEYNIALFKIRGLR